MAEFKVGDTVGLRPIMTITAVSDIGGTMSACCAWFAGGEKKEGVFSLEDIEHVKPEGGFSQRGIIRT